jgi:hypothetical protein
MLMTRLQALIEAADEAEQMNGYDQIVVSENRQGNAMHERSYEQRVRIAAKRQGLRLVKSRRRDRGADDYGLYVLVGDSAGNGRRGAQAPLSAFAKGEGMSLIDAAAEVSAVAMGSLWRQPD